MHMAWKPVGPNADWQQAAQPRDCLQAIHESLEERMQKLRSRRDPLLDRKGGCCQELGLAKSSIKSPRDDCNSKFGCYTVEYFVL